MFLCSAYRSFLVGLLVVTGVNAFSQQGIVRGIISDKSGARLVSASVLLSKSGKGTKTDEKGGYELRGVAKGKQNLVISAIGFERLLIEFNSAGNDTLVFNLQLSPVTDDLANVEFFGLSKSEKLQQSANAVDVITTERARLRTGDMGQLLSQTKGVNVRRNGSLGSEARFSLNGLTDDQIRFFVDGIPAQFSLYSNGIANIPVNLIDRVEVFKGVVPVRFGADALGGAVNMVSAEKQQGMHVSASYQFGSFGTHRATANISYAKDSSGFFAEASGFYDRADNNYKVDVELGDSTGALKDVSVRRFHDAYEAKAIAAGFGIRNRKWADELSVHGVLSDYFKEVQNNNIMTVPYGDVSYSTKTRGVNMIYRFSGSKFSLDLVGGFTRNDYRFTDTSTKVFNWYGKIINERFTAGEINKATDQLVWENNGFARLSAAYKIGQQHSIKLSLAPTRISRTGDERRQTDPSAPDPLGTERVLTTLVNGIELESNLANHLLQNILFVKQYLQKQESSEVLPGGNMRDRNRETQNYGAGNAVRYFLGDRILSKLSYEYATRLPNANEIFGDGRLSQANLQLKPEKSHNVNLEFVYNGSSLNHQWKIGAAGFLRSLSDMITQFGNDNLYSYQNVSSARSAGAEISASWSGFGERLTLDGNATYIRYVNTSTTGPFAVYKSDKIPNRPYAMGNMSAEYRLKPVSIFWNAGYIHSFYRGWQSAGLSSSKQIIPSQFSHNIGATLQLPAGKFTNALTGEIQNLTNARIYDNFGVQKPGIAFYLKFVTQL